MIAAFVSSFIDKKYLMIVALVYFSQVMINSFSYTLNIYELIPICNLISLALAIICYTWDKKFIAYLFFFEFMVHSYYLAYDIHSALNEIDDLILANFLYNGLHPSYIQKGVPDWINISSVIRLSILLSIVVSNAHNILISDKSLIRTIGDNLHSIYTYSKNFSSELAKDLKIKNPKTFYEVWKKDRLASQKIQKQKIH